MRVGEEGRGREREQEIGTESRGEKFIHHGIRVRAGRVVIMPCMATAVTISRQR